jgi:predicted transposase YbfD/YdcC
LRLLDLSGCIVTIDAMGLQKKIVKQIVDQQGDYGIALKKNHKGLYEQVHTIFEMARQDQFAHVKHQKAQTMNKGHGRLETRNYWIIDDESCITSLNPDGAWEKLRSIGMVESIRHTRQKVTTEVRYYLLSIDGDALTFAHAVRSHWGIENSVHWVLDVTFHEDLSRVRAGYADHNFAILRRIALNLLRHEKTDKSSIHTKRLKAGWNTDYLEKVLLG